jgi:UDP-glucose 4-epimerase
MAFRESYGIPVTVLRLSNVYGTNQSVLNPYCGVVARFFDKALKGEPIEIHGDGLSTRDFTYVEDVVEALLIAGISPRAEGEVFNVATGIETSVAELARMISNEEPVFIDRRDIDNIRRRVLNIEKIRRKLGWMPKYTLREGLRRTQETLCEQ